MAKETVYNNTLVSGAADETLTYTRFVKDESSGKSTKELLDEKVNKTDQLGTTQIADKAVTTEKLENESVTTDKLDAASVTTDKVADANITTSKLADSSVETEKINNKAVTTDKLNDGAVDNTKLSPNAVTSEKIKNESIITEKLNDRAVTTEKVEEKAITNAKLGDQSVDGRVVREASLESKHFANESVTTEKVARKSITKDKLADNAVDASQVVDGSIGNDKLSPDSVTTEKIKDGSVTNEKIADNTLGIEKFDPELRKTIQAATGLPEDLNQMIQDVDKSVKQLHEKDTDLQSQIDDKQQQITANDEDISLLQTRSTQMEEAIKNISASGGASQASAVTYENTESGLDSVTAQGAIDELANKNKSQDTEIAKKANSADVDSQIQTEQERVNAELDKKFDKENIAQEFGDSEDKVVSQFALPFREIESPEFIKAIVDAEDHFLLGIQLDGSIEWAKGIPAPVRQRIQEVLNYVGDEFASLSGKMESIKLELSGSLQTYQQTTDATLANIQDTKVDKEEGKSLIEDEVKECFRIIENEEFIKAIVDSVDKVLFGIYRATGEPYYPLNEMYHVEQNEEFFALWKDASNHVLLGIRRDGQIIGEIHAVNALKQVISQLQSDLASLQEKVGTIDTNLKELLDVFSLQDNEEYLAVEKDAEGKVLSATNADGSHYIHNAKSETIPEEFEHIEDPEGRMEITTDAEGRVVGYRDKAGKRYENDLSVEKLSFNNFEMGEKAVEKFNSIIKKNWKTTDWSNETDIHLPLPQFAVFNIICDKKLSSIDHKVGMKGFQIGVNCEIPAKIQFSDLSGNYFEKEIIFNAQGSSSMNFPIKNHAIDFSDGASIKFGDWIPMDSFHIKKYYIDVFRGQCVIAYHLAEQIMQSRNWDSRRGFSYLDTSTATNGDSSPTQDFNTESLCHPDGFPVEMYYNGEYIGLYAWTLKKHRSNYNMKKNDNKAIIIDGVSASLWKDTVSWKAFELKNPKKLYYTDYDSLTDDDIVIGGNTYLSAKHAIDAGYLTKYKEYDGKKYYEYDGDYADEICGVEGVDKGISKSIKDYIEGLHSFSKDDKETFASTFNIPLCIDYLLFSQFAYNQDGIGNNVVWTSYDLKKLNPNYYDLDCIFGSDWAGKYFEGSENKDISIDSTSPFAALKTLYATEIQDRYKELRDKNIFSAKNVVDLYESWMHKVGYDRLLKEISQMQDIGLSIPSHSSDFNNSIGRIEKWVIEKLAQLDNMYNYK